MNLENQFTGENITRLALLIDKMIEDQGHDVIELSEANRARYSLNFSDDEIWGATRAMCQACVTFVDAGHVDIALVKFGFIQAVLWLRWTMTIDEIGELVKSAEEAKPITPPVSPGPVPATAKLQA